MNRDATPFRASPPHESARYRRGPKGFYDGKREMVEVLGEDDFAELLGTFFEDMDRALSELETACQRQEKGQIDRLLHTIKGAAGNVGLSAIAAPSQRMRERAFSTREKELLRAEIGRYKSLLSA